jgi:succinate-semialdehyde dehydrogenase / glutarate-semialdehyde dehydrogenase
MNTLPHFTLNDSDLLCHENYIDGHWCQPVLQQYYDIENPADAQSFIQAPDSTEQDAELALLAASKALPMWRNTTARFRADILERWYQLILQHKDDLAAIMSSEQGKPLAEAKAEVDYGASYVRWFAQEALRVRGDTLVSLNDGKHQSVIKQAVGVVAAITPWNFPLAMIARKLAPALAAGCTVVAKPAEDTPLTALALVKLASMAGLPNGVINMICASREKTPGAVNVWLTSPEVRKITFTGSTAVGKYLAEKSAATLKKLSLELGGNAPFIVFDDCDLDAAVKGLMLAKFRNAGQTCVCPNRVYVQEGIYDAFAARLQQAVMQLKVGPAHWPDSQIGPMINQRAIDKIDAHVRDAEQKGATVLCGGTTLLNDMSSYFYAPTILLNMRRSMLIFSEETFGPVVPLFRFNDENDAIREANDTPFGLAAYFYTADIKRVKRLARALDVGVLGINEGAIASEAAPFGGVKESGYGREGSHYGLDDYLNIKYLCEGE